jgi:hypothetical protein
MGTRQLAAFVIMVFLAVSALAQRGGKSAIAPPGRSAVVEVLAFDTGGRLLGAPEITFFENQDQKNLASRFHSGIAGGVPFGVYRIKAHVPGFYSEVRYVRIYQPRTIILLGLEPGYEASPSPPLLQGRVMNQAGPPLKNAFVKLAGVFSSLSMESSVAPDGSFEFTAVPWGRYVLLVLNGETVVASRFVSLPRDGPSIVVDAGRDRAVSRSDVSGTEPNIGRVALPPAPEVNSGCPILDGPKPRSLRLRTGKRWARLTLVRHAVGNPQFAIHTRPYPGPDSAENQAVDPRL